MAIAGTLELQMFANIARLTEDMAKAKGVVGDTVHSIEKILGTIGVGFSADALMEKIKSVTEGMAKLKEASEKTGASVEQLSKLQFFASASGSNIDAVTNAMVKLSKGMAGAGNEGAAASQALKYLGLSAKDAAGNLKDPSELMGEISKKLINYQDGAGKAAIAQALFGKAGAEMLPTLKAMAEIGDIEASVTTKQAEAAKAYQIELVKLDRQKQILWQTITSALLPSMGSFVGVLLDASKETDSLGGKAKQLSDDKSIENWADMSAMGVARLIDLMKIIPDAIGAVLGSMQVVWNDIAQVPKHLALVAAVMTPGGPTIEQADAMWKAEQDKRTADIAAANDKWAALYDSDKTSFSRAVEAKIAARKAETAVETEAAGHKPLNFALGDAAKLAAELKLYESALQSLEQQLGKLNHQTEYEKTLYQELHGSLQKLTPAHKAHLLEIAKQIDAQKFLTETTDAYNKMLDELDAHEQARIERARQIIEGMQDNNEKIAFENSLIGMSADERERLNIEYERTIKLRGIDSQLQIDGINKQFDELAALVKTRQEMNQQVSTWTELSKGAGNFFGDLVVNGKSAFDRLRSSLKSFAQELIALFAQKWILNVAAASLGSTTLSAAAASAGGAGAVTSAFGSSAVGGAGGGLLTGAAGGFAGSSLSMMAGSAGGMFGGAGNAIANFAAESLGVTSSMALSAAQLIPVVGLVVAGVMALNAILAKGGGPKTEGVGTLGGYSGAGYYHGANDATAQALVAGVGTTYGQYAAALGGKAGAFGGEAFISQDPQGTALTQFQLAASVNGQSVYDRRASGAYENVGRSDAELQAAMEQATREALLGALKVTKFDDVTTAFVNTIDPTVEGFKELTDYMAAIGAQKSLIESLMTDTERLAAAQKALSAAGLPDTIAGFKTLASGLDITTKSGQDTLASMVALRGALETVSQAADVAMADTRDLLAAQGQVRSALRDVSDQVRAFAQRVIDTAKGVQNSKDQISQAYWAAQDNVNNLMRQAAESLNRFTTSIDDFLATLTPAQSLGSLKAQLSSTAVLAAGGDADSQSRIVNIAKAVLKAGETESTDRMSYLRTEAFVRSTLEGVRDALKPSTPLATTAAQDAAATLAAAKLAVTDLKLIADAVGATTTKPTAMSGTDLLAAYNAAVAESTAAQLDYGKALVLTASLNLTATDSMAGLYASLTNLALANGAVVSAQAALDKAATDVGGALVITHDQAIALATALGLTGTAAETLEALLEAPGTAAGTLATVLGLPGTNAIALAASLGLTGAAATTFTGALGTTAITTFLGSLTTTQIGTFLGSLSTTAITTFLGSLSPTQITTFLGALGTGSITAFLGAMSTTQISTFLGALSTGNITAFLGSLSTSQITGFTGALTTGNITSFLGALTTTPISTFTSAMTTTDIDALTTAAGNAGVDLVSLATALGVDDTHGTRGAAVSVAAKLGLAGTAADNYATLLNNLKITIPSVTTATTPTVTPASLMDQWVGDTWRASTGGTMDRRAGTFQGTGGASGFMVDAVSAMNEAMAAMASGTASEMQIGKTVIDNLMAQGFNGLSLDELMGWPHGKTSAWAVAHGLPAFAAGTNYLTSDGPIYGHQGEEIKPRAYVDMDRSARDETNALLARLIDSNLELRAEVAQLKAPMDATAKATSDTELIMEQVVFGQETVRTKAIP